MEEHAPHSATGGPGRLPSEQAAQITREAAALAVIVALVLVLLKGVAWVQSGSVAMLASLADSLMDLVASGFSFFAVRYAAMPPDQGHRYGHGKAEAFAGLFQAGLIIVSGAMIGVEAISRLVQPEAVRHGDEAILVMVLSIALTAGLIHFQTQAMKRTGSVATTADRAHYAADLSANLIAVVGIGAGAFLGWTWADAIAGLLITAWLVYGGWAVARIAADVLMDHELPASAREEIAQLVLKDRKIQGIHDLRTRASGSMIHIQMHAHLDSDLRLDVAHAIINAAAERIHASFPAADVIIHPDPRDRTEPHGSAEITDIRRIHP